MRRCYFFMKDFASIDHLTPLAFFLNKEKIFKVVIICNGLNYNYNEDKRISFLKKNNIDLINFEKFIYEKNIYTKLNILIFNFLLNIFSNINIRFHIIRKIFSFFLKKKENFSQKYFREFVSFLKIQNNEIGIFDYRENRHKNYKYFKNQLKKSGGLNINLNHSITQYNNYSRTYSMFSEKCLKSGISSFAYVENNDLCFAENKWFEDILKAEKTKKIQIKNFQQLRFSYEWLKILKKSIINKKLKFGKGKKKVLFLLPKTQDNVNYKEINLIIKKLLKINNLFLIIQSHPRSQKIYLDLSNDYNNFKIINFKEYLTSSLINWSDVVFDVNSTIFPEVLMLDKILVRLDYVQFNSYFFSGKECFLTCKTRDDLLRFFQNLEKNNLKEYSISKLKKNKFLELLNITDNSKILNKYYNFFKKIN